eukprot:CAMPEP_0116126222 /NCGR_PEP_ID=MMETSP0329-20121206/6221_1 /TAXON_ID=697910 /ORGANISM="Pseudo-nitzschia arenysensis, Strain B593" /LENGTH=579 /DNA_ID=CAMNT_0003620299 /DNA_START=90 /DNA_END=1829 /DNA_ORIENTATION=+
MPAIVCEEDYDDEVSRLLSSIPNASSSPAISVENPPQEPEEKNEHGDKLSELQNSLSDLQSSLHNLQNSLGSLSSVDQLNRSIGASNSSSVRLRKSGSSTPQSYENIKNLRIQGMDGLGLTGTVAPVIRLDKLEDRLNKLESVVKDDGEASMGSTFELCSLPSYVDPLNLSMGRSRRSLDRSRGSLTSSRHRYASARVSSSNQLNRSIGASTSSKRKGIGHSTHSAHSTGSKLAEVVVVPKKESIDKKYFVDHSREIGRGTNTIVRKCIDRATGNRYAVKTVRKSDTEEYENMRKEANLLTALDHPSIIKIYDTYEDDKHLHMVVEICKGGELYDHVVKPSKNKKGVELNCPTEQVAAVIVRQVVDAVAYLHEHNIVHRDLKLENLLFKMKPDDKKQKSLTDVRVIDFGLSRRYNTHHRFASLPKLTSFVGTKFYVAPEVLNKSYTHAVDLWSIGVLAYALLSAKAPFTGRNDQELFDKIQHCGEELKFPSPDFDNVSETAKDFIRLLLVKDEASRPLAADLLSHPWMMQASKWKDEIESAPISKASPFKKLFGRFGNKKSKNRKNELDGVNQHVISVN